MAALENCFTLGPLEIEARLRAETKIIPRGFSCGGDFEDCVRPDGGRQSERGGRHATHAKTADEQIFRRHRRILSDGGFHRPQESVLVARSEPGSNASSRRCRSDDGSGQEPIVLHRWRLDVMTGKATGICAWRKSWVEIRARDLLPRSRLLFFVSCAAHGFPSV